MYKKLEIYKTFIYSYILILFSVCVLFCIFNSFQRLFLFCVCSASFLNLNYSEFVFIFCCTDRSNRVACGYVYAWIVAGNICYSYGIGGGDKPKKKHQGWTVSKCCFLLCFVLSLLFLLHKSYNQFHNHTSYR